MLKNSFVCEEGYVHGYQSYPCLFMPKKISILKVNEIATNGWMICKKIGISTRPATHAVHMLSYYQKYQLKPEDFPNAHISDHCSISLPLFHGMKPGRATICN